MRALVRHLLLLLGFWFLIFFTGRIIFYSGISFLLSDVRFSLIVQSFFRSARLDLSMAGYLMIMPVLLLSLYSLFQKRWILFISDLVTVMLIILYAVTVTGEMCLYREWKAKLSMQALQHFSNPQEVFSTASAGLTITFFTVSILFSWLFIRIYRRKLAVAKLHPLAPGSAGKYYWKMPVLFILGVAACGLSIRGGLQQIPIQSSDAFFCTEPAVNDAAVNPLWNIAYNIIDYENHFRENPFKRFEQAEADRIRRSMFAGETDSTSQFLTVQKPNIVFILLESWSAHCVKSFGGEDFAPFSDSLSRQGIRFTKFYPAGYVSDQGIPAVLSGYPATSRISVINQSSKSAKIPCINEDLRALGYSSGFIFGGDLNYGNIRSYIYNKKFDVVKEEKDFPGSIERGKLGIQDGDMAKELLTELNEAPQSFVYSWFTLSSHMPYDHPGTRRELVKLENEYANSVGYSDEALRSFFREAKKQKWYANTLFVLVADHSHGSHRQLSSYDPEYHRIPFWLFGEVISQEWRGREVSDAFSQLDIVPSLLKQMGLDEARKRYEWGKDMFSPGSAHFAYYCNFSGAGMVSDSGYIGYQHDLEQLLFNSFGEKAPAADSLLRLSKAFEQSLYEDYRLK